MDIFPGTKRMSAIPLTAWKASVSRLTHTIIRNGSVRVEASVDGQFNVDALCGAEDSPAYVDNYAFCSTNGGNVGRSFHIGGKTYMVSGTLPSICPSSAKTGLGASLSITPKSSSGTQTSERPGLLPGRGQRSCLPARTPLASSS